MGNYFAVRFRAKLKEGGIKTVEEFERYAYERDLALQLDTAPLKHYGQEPSFGNDLVYAGTPFFDIEGVSITNSTLSLCVNGFNLFRPHFEEHDGVQLDPDCTRLDAVLQAFSDVAAGVEGEIQGVIGSEHHESPNGWPLIRCEDGIVRFAMTPNSGGDDDYGHAGYAGEVLAVLPDGFAKNANTEGYQIEIDLKALRERLMPLEFERALEHRALVSR